MRNLIHIFTFFQTLLTKGYSTCFSHWAKYFIVKTTGIELHINQGKKKKMSWAPLVAQLVKNLPAMQETWV